MSNAYVSSHKINTLKTYWILRICFSAYEVASIDIKRGEEFIRWRQSAKEGFGACQFPIIKYNHSRQNQEISVGK